MAFDYVVVDSLIGVVPIVWVFCVSSLYCEVILVSFPVLQSS